MSLSASAAGQLMFITGFPFQAEMYVFETEGQEMLLVDVNSLIVCKDKCSHKDSYKKKKKRTKPTFLRDWLLVLLTLEFFRLATIASGFTLDV